MGDWSMFTTLSTFSMPSIASHSPGRSPRAIEGLRQLLVQDFVDERAFAGAGYAGYAHQLS